jgi:hypothetical protein
MLQFQRQIEGTRSEQDIHQREGGTSARATKCYQELDKDGRQSNQDTPMGKQTKYQPKSNDGTIFQMASAQ